MNSDNTPPLTPAELDILAPDRATYRPFGPRYLPDPRTPQFSQTETYHLDGVPWNEATLPHHFHRCRPQTRGYISFFTYMARCACGAHQHDSLRWANKNSRRSA